MRCVIEVHKSRMPCFLCLSLLLSTTVLNDKLAKLSGTLQLKDITRYCQQYQNLITNQNTKQYHKSRANTDISIDIFIGIGMYITS